ncbi:hypothetical protein DYB25_013061, partial [Aphanomyces astaci]
RIDGGAYPVPNCPKLKGISQEQLRQWLLDRDTYEEDLRAVCMRRNLEVWKYREGWKECFEDKRLLKQFMIMRKLRCDPKELDEAVLETELRKIVDESENGVEADIPLLFHGIHMDMKDDDCLSRVCKFLADCDERIEARVMKGHLKKPEMRKKIFKRLLEVVDPEPVRDACVLDMEKVWHPVEFSWKSISELVMHHAQGHQQQKREAKKRKAKGLVETEDFIPLTNDSEDEVDEPDVIRRKGRTILNAKSAGANKTVRRVYGWDPSIRPGALAEDRAKLKYEWALVVKRMQNGTTLKPKAKKLRDSLMTANKKWREEQEKSREAKAKEPEKKKLRRMLESSAGERVATINGMLDVPYCPDNGSDVGINSTAMVKTLRKLDKTVQMTQLPKAWVGSAVGNLPVIAKTTVELRVTLSTAAG